MIVDFGFWRVVKRLLEDDEPVQKKNTAGELQQKIAADRTEYRRKSLKKVIDRHESKLNKKEQRIQHELSEISKASQDICQALEQLGQPEDSHSLPITRKKKRKNISHLLKNVDEAYGFYAGQDYIGQTYSPEKDRFIQNLNTQKF